MAGGADCVAADLVADASTVVRVGRDVDRAGTFRGELLIMDFSTHNYNKMLEVSFTEYVVVIVRYQGLRLHFVRLRPKVASSIT